MKRTGEVTLGIIGTILNLLGAGLLALMYFGSTVLMENPTFQQDLQAELDTNPNYQGADLAQVLDSMNGMSDGDSLFVMVFIGLFIISLIVGIVATVIIAKNEKPKLAGILFIIAGVFTGLLSLTAVLYYIAAIMCFVRKPKPVETSFDEYEELSQ